MSVIERLKSLVGGQERKQYSYECGDCGAAFESPARTPNDAECPGCGSDRIHTAL